MKLSQVYGHSQTHVILSVDEAKPYFVHRPQAEPDQEMEEALDQWKGLGNDFIILTLKEYLEIRDRGVY